LSTCPAFVRKLIVTCQEKTSDTNDNKILMSNRPKPHSGEREMDFHDDQYIFGTPIVRVRVPESLLLPAESPKSGIGFLPAQNPRRQAPR